MFKNTLTAELPKPNFEYITTPDQASRAVEYLSRYPILGLDTETTGLDPHNARIHLVQIGTPHKAFIFDIRNDTEFSSVDPDVFKPLLTSKDHIKILQNAVFDVKMVKTNLGYYINNIYDTMIAEQLLHLGVKVSGFSLAELVRKYLGLEMPKEAQKSFEDYYQKFKPFQIEYSANDVLVLHPIMDLQLRDIVSESLERVLDLECRFVEPLSAMELNGVLLHQDKWATISKYAESEAINARNFIFEVLTSSAAQNTLFGVAPFNIDSNQQLLSALKTFGIDLNDTKEENLSVLKDIPVVDAILEYRKNNKIVTTYADALVGKISKKTNRIHTRFTQMVSTGRMSSRNPNLQNIPKKQKFRSCFVAKPGYSLITSDMGSAELRILGNFSKDPIFYKALVEGEDLHTLSASKVFDLPFDEVTKAMRNSTKAITFGLCVDEDSYIYTDNGMYNIKDAQISSSIAHDIGTDQIIDKKDTGKNKVYQIQCSYGYTLNCTMNHQVRVIDKEGNYIDKQLKDVNPKEDLMCLKLGSNTFGSKTYKSILANNLNNDFLLQFSEEEILEFIALYLVRGVIRKKKKAMIFNVPRCKEHRRMDELLHKLGKTGGSVSFSKTDNFTTFIIKNKNLFDCIVELFHKHNKGFLFKKFPHTLLQSNKKAQSMFMRSMIELNMSVLSAPNESEYGRYFLKYRNGYTVKILQLMLLNFGIISNNYFNGFSYTLTIHRLSMKKCLDIFNIKTNKVLFPLNNNKKFIGLKYYNLEKRIFEVLSKKPDLLKDLDFLNLDYIQNKINRRTYLTQEDVKKISIYDPLCKFILDQNIIPLKIKAIEFHSEKNTCDISVANRELFLCDGFVVHNCYGLSKFGLAKRLNITEKEAQNLIDKYFQVFTAVKTYLDKSAADGLKNRASTSIAGRKRYYKMPPMSDPDANFIMGRIERQSKNAGIQSSNADTIKEGMIKMHHRMVDGGYDANLILTVHDEVIVESRDDIREEMAELVRQSIIDGFADYFDYIPMESDTLIGPCWLKDVCPKCSHNIVKFKKIEGMDVAVCDKCETSLED